MHQADIESLSEITPKQIIQENNNIINDILDKDNKILQNELLSKLIKTPKNLEIKYENEELNKFKDEILLYLNERNNHFLKLINYFQDKLKQTKEDYNSQLNLINQNYEAILTSQATILNKVDKMSNFELFMNKTNDQLITHEIRINNLSQDFIKATQKYDKIYLDNLELPGYIGKFAKFKNCQNFFDYVIREIDKMNLYKEKNNLDIRNNKERLDNTIKTFNLLFKNNNEAQMKYIRQINEKNFKECKDMNDALSNRVCDLRIENAKYSMELIKKSEEMGKDWNKIITIKDEMLDMVNEKINNFRKVFNGNTTLFNEFRKEYEEFKIKINEILNYFREIKNNENTNNNANNGNINSCNNYTGCYINSALPLEKKSFKHFSKFAKRAKSKNNKYLDKKQFIKSFMTINGNKNIDNNNNINYNENNNTNSGLIHIECMSKDKKNKLLQMENHIKKNAYGNKEPRSSKSVTKIEINSLNKVYTSREEIKSNNIINNIMPNNIKINEENNNNDINNNEITNNSDMNLHNKIKLNEINKDLLNSSFSKKSQNKENIKEEKDKEKEKEKEQIIIKINKKPRRSFAPSSKSIISYESENNNINDISNISSNNHIINNFNNNNINNEDLNTNNSSLFSVNSFNVNMNNHSDLNKFILNDNIIEANQQVIKELASELEQSTNKKEIINSNKKKIEENFKINRSKISKLNLNKNNKNNNLGITNSTEKTEDFKNNNNNINISISGIMNIKKQNSQPNIENNNNNSSNNLTTINKKMDFFDKKLIDLESLLKDKIVEILEQMEKLQNLFYLSVNNKLPSSRIKNSLYNTKETNFNFNINTTPNTYIGKSEANNDYINNINNLRIRNSQDDYFVGCSVKRLAPIIEIDVNNLQFSPSPARTQYKIFSSKKKEGRNKWNKSGFSSNFKDIKIKRNENKENIKPNYTNVEGNNNNNISNTNNNNGTQIRLFGKGGNIPGVNKWINLNKLVNYDKPKSENTTLV